MSQAINVEVVFALADVQVLVNVTLQDGATVADAITSSGLEERFEEQNLDALQAGIWGRPVDREQRLDDGDRVELYRALQRDPREARRQLARSGMTMSEPSDD